VVRVVVKLEQIQCVATVQCDRLHSFIFTLKFFTQTFIYNSYYNTLMNLNKRQIDTIYGLLVKEYGEFCSYCQKTPQELGVVRLEIHHTDYQEFENSLTIRNKRLMCHGCNHLEIFRKSEINSERAYTPEHKVKIDRERGFRRWMWDKVQTNNHHYSYDEIVASGAYQFDVSIITIKRWIMPLVSEDGAFKITAFGKL